MVTELALFLLRVTAGVVFLIHGWPKLRNWKGTFQWLMKEKWPLPLLSTTLLIIGEVFGGVFLILGILTVPVAVLMAVIMLGAALYHLKKKQGWDAAEKAVLLMAICIALAIAGGGAWQLAPLW